MISAPPPELVNETIPGLLARVAVVSSKDLSFGLTRSELRIYEWAIANRKSIRLDEQSMDRYARRSSETLDAILISTHPDTQLSEKQIRSWLVWQTRGLPQSGSMTFADSTGKDAGWINALATSIEFVLAVGKDDVAADKFSMMPDDEILKLLKSGVPEQL